MSRSHLDSSINEYINHPQIASMYDSCFKGHPLFAYDQQFLYEHVVPGSLVLDVGVGTGRHVLPLLRSGCRVVGVDLSSYMLAAAQKKLRESSLSASLVQADMLDLPFTVGADFEVVLLLFSTLGLVHGHANRIAVIKQIAGLLGADGRIILHVHNDNYRLSPNRAPVRRLHDMMLRAGGKIEQGDHIIKNYRCGIDLLLHSFTLAEIKHILSEAGLQIMLVEGLNARRDAACASVDLDRDANGFMVIASKPAGVRL